MIYELSSVFLATRKEYEVQDTIYRDDSTMVVDAKQVVNTLLGNCLVSFITSAQ